MFEIIKVTLLAIAAKSYQFFIYAYVNYMIIHRQEALNKSNYAV